jgi:hypothetical protein
MRQLTAGLAIMALALTGCAATTSTSSGKTPAPVPSHSAPAPAGTSGTGAAGTRLGGMAGGGSAGPAQWVVDGTFQSNGGATQPLAGTVSFRDSSTGRTVKVTVGASGKFSLGLVAGTYTATAQAARSASPCPAPVTVTVRAGQTTRVALGCPAALPAFREPREAV